MRALSARQRGERRFVPLAHVLTWRSQLSTSPSRVSVERRTNAAAPVVAGDDDVPHLQHVDGVLQHRQAVQVGVHDDVGDVAVNEQLAWQQADDLVGRHAAVRAANPQVLGRLLLLKARKELRVLFNDGLGPGGVVAEESSENVHASG